MGVNQRPLYQHGTDTSIQLVYTNNKWTLANSDGTFAKYRFPVQPDCAPNKSLNNYEDKLFDYPNGNKVLSITTGGTDKCTDYADELDIKSERGGGKYVYTEHVNNRPKYVLSTDATWKLEFHPLFYRWHLENKTDRWRPYTSYKPVFQPDCPPDNEDGGWDRQTPETFSITDPSAPPPASSNNDSSNNDSTNSDSSNNDSSNNDSTNNDSTNTATNAASTKKTTDAEAEVINCNDKTTKAVQIKAAVTNPTNDFDAASGWTKDPDNSARWIKTYALADLGNPEFIKEGEEDWMVLTATEGTTGCEKIKVDGVDICKDIGESYSFKCKYNLKDQTIKDTFSVTGQDTEVDAEGIGELSYTIEVDENVEIGETVNFTINPASPGLVFATATECHVKNENQEVTIFGHRTPKCYTSAVGAKWATTNANPSSKNNIKGEWTAFKWSTSTDDTDAESQTFECTIALSKEQDPKTTTTCPSNK